MRGLVLAAAALAALLFTAAFVHLLAAYWAYWDMGVNPGANAGALLFLYAPAVLAGLLATGVAAVWLGRRRLRTGTTVGVALLAEAVVAAALFLAEVHASASQRFGEQGMGDFIAAYAARVSRGDWQPERRHRDQP